MFITPPPRDKMVATRSGARTDQGLKVEKCEVVVSQTISDPQPSGSRNITSEMARDETKSRKSDLPKHVDQVNVRTESKRRSEGSRKQQSTASSTKLARRKHLEYQAAEAKARIQTDLIELKLQADLAELETNYSPRNSIEEDKCTDGTEIEEWLERNQQELESQRRVHDYGMDKKDEPCPPISCNIGTEGTSVQLLVNALKEFANTSVSSGHNAKLLSRLSTPRELPIFSGDAMEWLEFKQAYNESTQVCNFSPTENLWRLRKCLRGPAKEAVTALLLSASSPDIVMSTLELQFGNPDIILSRILLDIKKMQAMSNEYHKDIVQFSTKVKNYVAAVQALGREDYLNGVSIIKVILSKLPTILLSKWTDYSYPLISQEAKSQLIILSEFLYNEAVKVSHTSVNLLNLQNTGYSKKIYDKPRAQNHNLLLQTVDKCKFCRKSKHNLPDCKQFKKSMRKDRWYFVKRNGICFKCLESNHARENCSASPCDIDNCGQSHHRLLHYVCSGHSRQNNMDNNVPVTEHSETLTAAAPATETVNYININCARVLLKCVPIYIHGPNGVISANALLDDGSTVSLISSELATRVGVRGRKECMRVRGAWDHSELQCTVQLIDLSVSNRDGTLFTIRARSVNDLNLPEQDFSSVKYDTYDHLNKIKNYNIMCNGQMKPEVLIGQDNYHLMLPLEVLAGKPTEPCATRTPLGWCLHGQVPRNIMSRPRQRHATLFISDDIITKMLPETETERLLREINEEVRKSYSIDSMGVCAKPRRNADEVRALKYLEESSSLVNGRWYVGLPWRDKDCKMTSSFHMAFSRLLNLEKKMKANDQFSCRYRDRINHLFDNDYAKEIINPQITNKTWYIPHFGIDNPNKSKLRLVFDAAACTNNQCLNNYLLTGPDLLMSLLGIMLRFRENRIAVTGDIRDMFLRVKIKPQDQDAFRFLWRDNPSEPVRTFNMTSLIFGASCSPFIAQFVKNKNAERFESTMKTAVDAIYTQHYMDDYIDSLPDDDTAIEMVSNITYIHKQGGFDMRNWTSNSEKVLNSVPKEALGPAAVRFKFDQQCAERTLGLIWHPNSDTFGFDTFFKRIPEKIVNGVQKPTKREMLRLIMSIFDVYGFILPFTINGRILLQDTWRSNIDWDDVIPDSIFNKWRAWLSAMKTINSISLPRCYLASAGVSETNSVRMITAVESRASETPIEPSTAAPNSESPPSATSATMCATATNTPTNSGGVRAVRVQRPLATPTYTDLQLHIFCDASTKAMCAVAYWRWINNNRCIQVAFVCSKGRVAPVKHVSVPRLELQAALLAARLADTLIKEHRLQPTKTYYWSDSTTVLHWIHNDARGYKAYVAHRLGEIDELSRGGEWRYVPTKMNIADIATREMNCSTLPAPWFSGPLFLSWEESLWPKRLTNFKVNEQDLESVNTMQATSEHMSAESIPNPDRFSSWLRLLRATAVVWKFILKCRKNTEDIDDSAMRMAENMLTKYSQNQSFNAEISVIKNKGTINKTSRLITLSPYLDCHDVLRVGGRIDAAADVSPEMKRPIILDGKDYVTRLIVRFYHIRAAHGNQELVVNELKQKYYIIKLRPTVKYVAAQCMFCRIRKTKPVIPRMGDLPAARMAHHQRPFSFCGVDLFGPLEITVGRRREKRYCVLFTCLTIRAIHIEIVNSLTTDSLIMALRRMAARRGWPQQLFSDNGTNLRGADNELKKAIKELDQDALKNEALNNSLKWNFIPPASPHWGGAWERLIRSVKTSLAIILKERAPKMEVLSTLLAEVENIVNSRPLVHVSVEPNSDAALTPNHFLLGTSSNLSQMGKFDNTDLYLRKQWRISQSLADQYWRRWLKEVLPQMLPRKKWNTETTPLEVGDLVLVVDPEAPRNIWPRGRIGEVLPGKDGRVRMVRIRTQSGELVRSASKIARIPVDIE